MELSKELVSKFAKVVNSNEKPSGETGVVVEGTAKSYDGKIYVQLDGSDQLTPVISSTAGMRDGDRVTVMIKDHTAKVTGNTSSPSAGSSDLDDVRNEVADQITEVEILIADKVSTSDLEAVNGRIDNLVSDNITIKEQLTAASADIGELEADNVVINEKLTAAEADIDDLRANMLTAEAADIKYATIENLEATNADIFNLKADYAEFEKTTTDKLIANDAIIADLDATKLNAEQAEILFANIDFANIGEAAIENFFSKSGMIEDLVVSSGTVTGTLVGVTIIGDSIEGGTVKADKLVVLGEDGLYYKLNVSAETVGAEQTEYNSLSGTIITAKSITAEKVNVDDLVAFNATIGGYHITSSSLYSGVKSSAINTTRGVYMNDDGEFAAGDANNFIKFFKDEDGTYKLDLSAANIKLGASQTDIGEAVSEAIESASEAAASAEETAGKVGLMESSIELLNDSIASLVTDENGTSLMTQTSDGWRFDISGIQDSIDSALNDISNVKGDVSEIANLSQQTSDLANDIAEKTAYITMSTDETGSPCIELGKENNPFKVRITNTSIDFMQDSQKIAYITNRSLYIQSSVVTDEMKIGDVDGGFIWKKRGNGNMGLRWEAG